MKKIVLTGGGTGGHVTPNIALLPSLAKNKYDIHYIGSKNGIEKEILSEYDIPYYSISTGKLRRYLDFKNVTDAFRIVKGVGDAVKLIRKISPDIIFSKGGFVSVPVVLAGKICGVPVIIHESDITSGLANKIAMPFATAVCVAFPEAVETVEKDKAVLTGTPIRKELFTGKRSEGLNHCAFPSDKPVILMIGGSQGSKKLNTYLRESLNKLLKKYNVIHICGKGNLEQTLLHTSGYKQFEYVKNELPHILAASDLIISRAGANSIYEILALKKPNILIPLSKEVSRGDQILNADSFSKQGFSLVLQEEELTSDTLILAIEKLFSSQTVYIKAMEKSPLKNGVAEVISVIKKHTKD